MNKKRGCISSITEYLILNNGDEQHTIYIKEPEFTVYYQQLYDKELC